MARQRLGQHFLTDQNILSRIAAEACDAGAPILIEIGPGKGALTEHLLRCALHVVGVELDSALAQGLMVRFPPLEVVHADALHVDLQRWPGAPVAGNLPYYVASPIISRVVRLRRRAVFLIQKEVAERITALPGSRDYGYFSVDTQYFARATLLFTVQPGAFRPPPQVESAVVRLEPVDSLPQNDSDQFLRFVSLCFRHKRKTLRNNLAAHYAKELLDPQPEVSRRAETLSLPEFASLFDRLVR